MSLPPEGVVFAQLAAGCRLCVYVLWGLWCRSAKRGGGCGQEMLLLCCAARPVRGPCAGKRTPWGPSAVRVLGARGARRIHFRLSRLHCGGGYGSFVHAAGGGDLRCGPLTACCLYGAKRIRTPFMRLLPERAAASAFGRHLNGREQALRNTAARPVSAAWRPCRVVQARRRRLRRGPLAQPQRPPALQRRPPPPPPAPKRACWPDQGRAATSAAWVPARRSAAAHRWVAAPSPRRAVPHPAAGGGGGPAGAPAAER